MSESSSVLSSGAVRAAAATAAFSVVAAVSAGWVARKMKEAVEEAVRQAQPACGVRARAIVAPWRQLVLAATDAQSGAVACHPLW